MLRRRRRRPRPEPRAASTALRNPTGAAAANRYRIDTLAAQQRGLVTWRQLRRRGVAKAALTRAVAAGRLHRVHPGIYSTIQPSLLTIDAWHAAAVLAGGPDACLCGPSAAWWLGLTNERPPEIHVAVMGDRSPLTGVVWHRLRLAADERISHRRMPVTAPARVPLDLAGTATVWELKRVLAELEFRFGLGPDAVRSRRGMSGAAKLRTAISDHTPQLAATRSHLEEAFAAFLVRRGFALPAFNHPLGKSTVDAVYERQRLAIELDGVAGHAGERRILRDHRRDLHRRADGMVALRYHFAQLIDPADQLLIEEELDRYGVPRR